MASVDCRRDCRTPETPRGARCARSTWPVPDAGLPRFTLRTCDAISARVGRPAVHEERRARSGPGCHPGAEILSYTMGIGRAANARGRREAGALEVPEIPQPAQAGLPVPAPVVDEVAELLGVDEPRTVEDAQDHAVADGKLAWIEQERGHRRAEAVGQCCPSAQCRESCGEPMRRVVTRMHAAAHAGAHTCPLDSPAHGVVRVDREGLHAGRSHPGCVRWGALPLLRDGLWSEAIWCGAPSRPNPLGRTGDDAGVRTPVHI